MINPESDDREKPVQNNEHEVPETVIARNDGIQNSTLGFEKIFYISLPE